MFENLAHVVIADSKWPRLKIYERFNKKYSIPALAKMISGNAALRGIQSPFISIGDLERATTKVSMLLIRCGDDVWALQYTVTGRTHRDAYRRPHRGLRD